MRGTRRRRRPQARQRRRRRPSVGQPVQRGIVEWDEYTGRFDAVETVEIRARVSGYLNEVHFKDGQARQAGRPAVRDRPRPFERTLEQARAELLQATTKVENANLDVMRGKPLLERRDHLRQDLRRPREPGARRAGGGEGRGGQGQDRRARPVLHRASPRRSPAASAARMVTAGNWVSAGGTSSSARCSPPSSARTRSTSTSTSARTTISSTSAWPSAA